ncbi:MAG TPA: hypothetical protein VFZ25_08500 [Chloroflexota bacterium]|nr:hypothetical protein [Chloroflexota bacterium]
MDRKPVRRLDLHRLVDNATFGFGTLVCRQGVKQNQEIEVALAAEVAACVRTEDEDGCDCFITPQPSYKFVERRLDSLNDRFTPRTTAQSLPEARRPGVPRHDFPST